MVFTVLTTLVAWTSTVRKSDVEAHYSDLSAPPMRQGNVALVQSFVRIDAEVQGLRFVADKLLAVQMPRYVVGAGHRHHPGIDHHHRAGDLLHGIAGQQGILPGGEIDVRSFATC